MSKKISSILIVLLIFGAFYMYKSGKIDNLINKNNNQSSQSSSVVDSNSKTTFEVDACDLKGDRKPNSTVDVGFGERKYFAHTNSSSQLVKVEASEIIAQKASETPTGKRYCKDEAKVKGTERHDMDQGHAIADSLGGVSNSYNITPQKDELNRHGKQAEMEKAIRAALKQKRKVTDFIYNIVYENENTQLPSSYNGSYKIDGKSFQFNFENK